MRFFKKKLFLSRSNVQIKEIRKLALEYDTTLSNKDLSVIVKNIASPFDFRLSALCVLVKRLYGIELFDSQLTAIIASTSGYIVDMATGEGKTLVAGLSAILLMQEYERVFVAMPNTYLATTGLNYFSRLFEILEIKAGSTATDQATIIYDSLKDICLTVLNHQVGIAEQSSSFFFFKRNALIIDEVDLALVESATSNYSIMNMQEADSSDFLLTRAAIMSLPSGAQYYDDSRRVFLKTFYDALPLALNESAAALYSAGVAKVNLAKDIYLAEHILVRGVEYDIQNDVVVGIDQHTGRICTSVLPEPVRLALHLKEGLPLPTQATPVISVSLLNFIRYFDFFTGMSGTASCYTDELKAIANKDIIKVEPLFNKFAGSLIPYEAIESSERMLQSIVDRVWSAVSSERPVLIVCANESEVHSTSEILHRADIIHRTVIASADLDTDGADFVLGAGYKRAVTVTTRMAGRGIDIALGSTPEEAEQINEAGGLLVIATSPAQVVSGDEQLRGRTARMGRKGECVVYVTPDGPFFAGNAMGQRLLRRLVVGANCSGATRREKCVSLNRMIKGIQNTTQKAMQDRRLDIMKHDEPLAEQLRIVFSFKARLMLAADQDAVLDMLGNAIGSCSATPLATQKAILIGALAGLWHRHTTACRDMRSSYLFLQRGSFVQYRKGVQSLFEEFSSRLIDELVRHLSVGRVEYLSNQDSHLRSVLDNKEALEAIMKELN